MAYRKLEVDGVLYEYTIGRTNTKIRNLGAWPNEQIGHSEVRYKGNLISDVTPLQVKPSDVAKFIRSLI